MKWAWNSVGKAEAAHGLVSSIRLPVVLILAALLGACGRQSDPATRVKKAQALLHEDARGQLPRGNAWRAEDVLLSSRTLSELTPEELALVCKARNEIGDSPAQLQAAEELWRKAPGTTDAVRWMENSMVNNFMRPGCTQKIIDFADLCLSKRYGNPTDMLALKAGAILKGGHGPHPLTTAEALLVRAYTLTNAATSERSLRSVFRRMERRGGPALPKERQAAVLKEVDERRMDILIYGHHLPYKDIPMPEPVVQLVSTFTQAYAHLDFVGVTNLFIPPSTDQDTFRQQKLLMETYLNFQSAHEEGVTNFPVLFRPLCFDATNAIVLLDGMRHDDPRPVQCGLHELQLAFTNGQWRILLLRKVLWADGVQSHFE